MVSSDPDRWTEPVGVSGHYSYSGLQPLTPSKPSSNTVQCVMELQELGHASRRTTQSPLGATYFQDIAQLETPVDFGAYG